MPPFPNRQISRREWLTLGALGFAGCTLSTSPNRELKAGPFSVTVPGTWARSAIIKEVPLNPLYTAADWKAYRSDPAFAQKPDYANRPQHWALRFPAACTGIKAFDAKAADSDPTTPQILIHKTDEWELAFTDGVHADSNASAVKLRMRRELEALASQDTDRISPAFLDAHLDFRCLKKSLNFDGGNGIRMIGQWDIEPQLVRRGQLHYLFVGLSADNTCQLIATFPVSVPGLPPQAGDDSHLGRSTKNYQELEARFGDYQRDAKRWIEANAHAFNPSLETLDGIMRSLVVKHWP